VRGQKKEHIPKTLDALFLETGTFSWYEKPMECIETLQKHIQYRPVFEEVEKRKIPVVFGDLKYKYNDALLILADNILPTLSWTTGMRMLSNMISGVRTDRKKRNLPWLVLYGGAAAWLLLPGVANFLHLGSSIAGVGQSKTAKLKQFSHKLHPEADLLYLSLRNAILAEKMDYFAETLRIRLNRRPHVGIVLGAGHVGIEDMLTQTQERRITYLMRWRELLKKLVRNEYFYTIMELDYKGKNWEVTQIIEENRLKRLIWDDL